MTRTLLTPQSPVLIGDVAATTTVPFVKAYNVPHRVRDIAVQVDTDVTGSWKLEVLKINKEGTTTYASPPLDLTSDGLTAYVWRTVLADAGLIRNETLALRATLVSSGASLSGLAVSYGIEVRI